MEGIGRFEYQDGTVYEGQWKLVDGKKVKHGKGHIVIASKVYHSTQVRCPLTMISKRSTMGISRMIRCAVRECMCINLVQCIADSFERTATMALGSTNFLTVVHTKGNGSIIKCMVKECLWIRRVIVGKESSLKASINLKCRSNSKWRRCLTRRKPTFVRMLHTSSQNS